MAITISGSGITSANILDGTIAAIDINSAVVLGVTDAEKVNLKSGRKNLIINGKFQVNQRGAASKTATSSAYNYDRWYYDGTDLRYKVEAGDFLPSTTYTISGTNVTTAEVTSPASGNWTFTVPSNADLVQLELGSLATDFEHRSYGEELALCQRYYQKSFLDGVTPANGATTSSFSTENGVYIYESNNSSDINYVKFPSQMRGSPVMVRYGNSLGYSWAASSGFHVNAGAPTGLADGFWVRQQVAGSYQYCKMHWTADAEL